MQTTPPAIDRNDNHRQIVDSIRSALALADQAGLATAGIHLDAALVAMGEPGVMRDEEGHSADGSVTVPAL